MTASERMAGRRKTIQQGREHFRSLPKDYQEELKRRYIEANEEAERITRDND